MATGTGIALPEPLQGDDAKSWFKRFEVCAAANDWNAAKKLLRVPTLLKGRAWAIFDSLTEAETDSYDHLKSTMLAQLAPDSDEERMRARDELSQRRYREGLESVDELARDIEKLLDRAAPGLEGAVRTTELRFYLISALPERISFQLKLLPKVSYRETITKAKELCLMFSRADQTKMEQASQLSGPTDRLNKLEEAVQQVSQQMAALGKNIDGGYNKRPRNQVQCYNCGRRGHLAHNR